MHMDIAAPGFDNLQYSTANICGKSGTGLTKDQVIINFLKKSGVCGNWYTAFPSTTQCYNKCATLPAQLRAGCQLFSLWGWKTGNPTLTYQLVTCPPKFVSYIKTLFGSSGVIQNAASKIFK
jgi:hypothetical protein